MSPEMLLLAYTLTACFGFVATSQLQSQCAVCQATQACKLCVKCLEQRDVLFKPLQQMC